MDNLLDFFKAQVLKTCPNRLGSVEYRSIRDRYKPTDGQGTIIDGKPKAWTESLKMLNRWRYTDASGSEIDLGPPAEWGPDCILVIDSLSRWCDAAFAFHESIIPRGRSGDFDGRAVYGNAQRDVEKQIAMLTSDTIRTNLIVICHGTYQERDDGKIKIFPQGIGEKLSPKIPSYFPNYIRYTTDNGKRTIQLKSDRMIDLAVARPDTLGDTLEVETGLAQFFAALRGQPAKTTEAIPPRPKSVTLRKI
jgi:hypothetical protein